MNPRDDEKRRQDADQEGVPLWARLLYVCVLLGVLGLVWWLVLSFGGEGR